MIVTFSILGIITVVGCAATILALRNDSPGPRPFRKGYDTRHPQ
jgi:hypothetical protein